MLPFAVAVVSVISVAAPVVTVGATSGTVTVKEYGSGFSVYAVVLARSTSQLAILLMATRRTAGVPETVAPLYLKLSHSVGPAPYTQMAFVPFVS